MHVHSCMTVQEVRGSTPGTDSQTQASIHSRSVSEYTITNSGLILLFEKLRISGTEGFKMICVALQELTVTCNVSGNNG